MSYRYEIKAQLIKAGASFEDEKVKNAVKNGIFNYNAISLIAKNKKQILDYEFIDNDMTLCLELQSNNELPTPSKALKVLSTYLVKCDCMSSYVSNKQLLKMDSKIISDDRNEKNLDLEVEDDISYFERISRYVKLLENASRCRKDLLDKIDADITQLLDELN